MTEKIRVGDQWYVSAKAARVDESPHVLKHNETFVLFDHFGDVQWVGSGDLGVYHEDMRHLSQLELLIDGVRPMFLGSAVKEDNSVLVVELMNPDLPRHDVPKGVLHIFRAKLLWQDACYEHLRITNHGEEAVKLHLGLQFAADFVDLFEVRGMTRRHRGELLPPQVGRTHVQLSYRGLDHRVRSTRLSFDPAPDALNEREAEFELALEPKQEAHLYLTIACEQGDTPKAARPVRYEAAFRRNDDARRETLCQCGTIETSNPLVNRWLSRSVCDLAMLTTALPTGPYPYAGVPWYATTFGRDGILTAREMLWLDPSLARGVLAFLASTQAGHEDRARDAEPGKILHEARKCEMAYTNEVPFGLYYGTVDATPLFVGLAGAYYHRTGDLEFVRGLWPNVLRALEWMDRFGDHDGDGFVEYARRSENGLVQQGWKDSNDSVFHADGSMAQPPIALAEVQGYVYEAKLYAAELAARLGDMPLSQRLQQQARALKEEFVRRFWCDELGVYALALDGRKERCAVAASNAGHALWAGIAAPEHAAVMARRFLEADFHSGWGIRTLAEGQARYNPMSYHNGSIWPHDNALIAAGLGRYGHTQGAMAVFDGLFAASVHFEQHRLPELFCGFPRRPHERPTLYPVACSPQAWAAAAVFGVVQACLGLEVHAEPGQISLHSPRLPEFVDWMRIRNLAIGERSVDLLLQRYENHVGIDVTGKRGDLSVSVLI
jgi:glycogen debranching enzyme